jgi:hypothetical protein
VSAASSVSQSEHHFPYDSIGPQARWDSAVARVARDDFDPQGSARFAFDRSTVFASAGSCFARHLATRLHTSSLRYLRTEPGPAWLDPEQRLRYNYVPLPARFGDVYTSLQLLQLLRRACGTFVPEERPWEAGPGFADPFRPRIQPGGFETIEMLERDRAFHLAAVGRMFRELDVFVFTLGLTEVWCSPSDGAAFPICPGRGAGRFDPDRYVLRVLRVADNVRYLREFLAELRAINPSAKVLLSVSPVPLAATLSGTHVARASAVSKAVLRAAVDEVVSAEPDTDYLATFELVTAPYFGTTPFAPDRRHVSDDGVERVMRMFSRHFLPGVELAPAAAHDDSLVRSVDAAPCDEDELLNLLR